MVAQWIAIGLTAFGLVAGFWYRSNKDAELRGKQNERIDFMKGEIIQLQKQSQTEGEREALALVLDERFKAHEQKDDMRFDSLTMKISIQLEKILAAVNGRTA